MRFCAHFLSRFPLLRCFADNSHQTFIFDVKFSTHSTPSPSSPHFLFSPYRFRLHSKAVTAKPLTKGRGGEKKTCDANNFSRFILILITSKRSNHLTIVEKIYKQASWIGKKKVIIIVAPPNAHTQFAINTSWNLNEHCKVQIAAEENATDLKRKKKEGKKRIKVKAGGIFFLTSLVMLKRALKTMRSWCRLRETLLSYNSASRGMGEGQQQSLCFMSHPPSAPRNVQVPTSPFSSGSTTVYSRQISFSTPNPIAHYPVHCIRALIFSFSCSREERAAFMINPLYSNK